MSAVTKQDIIRSTLAALARPRRLFPIGLVCLPVVLLEAWLGQDPLGVLIAALFCVFPIAAPLAWRLLVSRSAGGLPRTLLYGVVGALFVGLIGLALPRLIGMEWTLVTDPPSLMAVLVVWWVGGWSLGRDIDLETDLDWAVARHEAVAREAAHARLLAVQRHLDPHFLFNTLNAIAEWCAEDPKVAEEATLRLSNMLRVILEGVKVPTWPLEKELSLVADLVALYRIRDPDKLIFERSVAQAPPAAPVPAMILLNLVENAIKHGPWAGHPGPIRLSGDIEGGRLHLRVRNPGRFAGFRPDGEGLPMLKRRLEVAYGGRGAFEIGPAGDGTEARLVLPLAPRGGDE